MTAPASFERVLAALRRLSPVWPSTDDGTGVGEELKAIATAIGIATDPLDGALEEVFPDATDQIIDRWEKVTNVLSSTTDSLATRRARIEAVLRRTAGPRVDQLAAMLVGPLACSVDDMVWVEPLRSMIDEGITYSSGALGYSIASAVSQLVAVPWPGIVDSYGVHLYISASASSVPVTLTHADGTAWSFTTTSAAGWYQTRTSFTNKIARGPWTLAVGPLAATTLTEFKLLVSNDIDSPQIYNFFVLRDPALAGSADLVTAQFLLHRTALAHMRAFVVENLAFTVGDSHSLVGRDPVGA